MTTRPLWSAQRTSTCAGGARLPVRQGPLHRTPGLLPAPLHRPVDEVQVHPLHPEPAEARVAGAERLHVAVVGVPELRRDEDLPARHPARGAPGGDVLLVAVGAGRVDVTVAVLERD